MNLKAIIKDNKVYFEYYRANFMYYRVYDKNEEKMYIFPVPLDDIGDATLLSEDKAIYFMRYIRKAINDKTLVQYHKK